MKKPPLTNNPKFRQGIFTPEHPEKYAGPKDAPIIYRSGLELRYMKYFDTKPAILKWLSEEVVVPYISPLDGKQHRYYPDFIIKVKDNDGNVKTFMIEIKPHHETVKPVKGKKRNATFMNEAATYINNMAKWKAAESFCEQKNISFGVWTEKELKWL